MPTKKKASTTTTKKTTARAAKKPAAKKPAAKKAAAKKPPQKAAAKKVVKKAAKKTTAKKIAKKATKKVVKKAAKKATAKKIAKKAADKVVKKAAKKAAAKPAKKAATKKETAEKATTKKLDIASLASAYADPAAIPLPAKKSSAKADGHGAIALPAAKKKALDVAGYGAAKPSSKRAAVTVVPTGDDAMHDAFDAVFEKPKKLAKSTVPFVPGDPSLDLAQTCAALALEKKADDVVILQVAELTSYADYFVIAAAASERQAQAIARNISDELRRRGKHPLSTDGLEQGNWVIVDYGSVVVHVFMESARAYYDLDGFWIDAPRVDVDEGRGAGHLEHLGS